jgi:N-acyl-D-aspartate/D-glutamate deacylase
MSDENIRKKVSIPWLSFSSDAATYSAEGDVLTNSVHPRAYGSFARVLGRYVRELRLISMSEAIRKLSGLPATNLKIKKRGFIRSGFFADIVIFDPLKVSDRATFDKPHQLAQGIETVLVNGVLVLKNGNHTGATPGKFVHGPGFKR